MSRGSLAGFDTQITILSLRGTLEIGKLATMTYNNNCILLLNHCFVYLCRKCLQEHQSGGIYFGGHKERRLCSNCHTKESDRNAD